VPLFQFGGDLLDRTGRKGWGLVLFTGSSQSKV